MLGRVFRVYLLPFEPSGYGTLHRMGKPLSPPISGCLGFVDGTTQSGFIWKIDVCQPSTGDIQYRGRCASVLSFHFSYTSIG